MSIKKILIFLYKKLSIIYVFVFGRKSMQFFNDIVLSLSLNAKGFKNYGNLNLTGEKRFIKLIGKEINFSIDIGANVGKYTKLLLAETNSEVIAFEPLPKAFEELKEIEKNFSSRLNVYNIGIGNKNSNLELNYSTEKSELASFIEDLDKLSFIDSKNNGKSVRTYVYYTYVRADIGLGHARSGILINLGSVEAAKDDEILPPHQQA